MTVVLLIALLHKKRQGFFFLLTSSKGHLIRYTYPHDIQNRTEKHGTTRKQFSYERINKTPLLEGQVHGASTYIKAYGWIYDTASCIFRFHFHFHHRRRRKRSNRDCA